MGCDIHSVIQVKTYDGWKTVMGRPGGDDRNYHSFAVLANVRNGYGFAGVLTGNEWPYISEPRGLPEGIQVENEETECPAWYWSYDKEKTDPRTTVWLGDHSHSWVTLKEMKWALKELPDLYKCAGVVERTEYERMKRDGVEEPNYWSGGVSGHDVVVVSQDKIIDNPNYTHVQMNWFTDTKKCIPSFIKYIEEMEKFATEYVASENQVRLVFGFDS